MTHTPWIVFTILSGNGKSVLSNRAGEVTNIHCGENSAYVPRFFEIFSHILISRYTLLFFPNQCPWKSRNSTCTVIQTKENSLDLIFSSLTSVTTQDKNPLKDTHKSFYILRVAIVLGIQISDHILVFQHLLNYIRFPNTERHTQKCLFTCSLYMVD